MMLYVPFIHLPCLYDSQTSHESLPSVFLFESIENIMCRSIIKHQIGNKLGMFGFSMDKLLCLIYFFLSITSLYRFHAQKDIFFPFVEDNVLIISRLSLLHLSGFGENDELPIIVWELCWCVMGMVPTLSTMLGN